MTLTIPATAAGTSQLEFGDGATQSFTGPGPHNASHTYAVAGTYTVWITDAAGKTGWATVRVSTNQPVLNSLTPYSMALTDPDTTMVARGTGFDGAQSIYFNWGREPTTYGTDPTRECSTVVKPSTASGPATVPVFVENGNGVRSGLIGFGFTETEARAKRKNKST